MNFEIMALIAVLMSNAVAMGIFDSKDSIKRVIGVLALNNLICFGILGIIYFLWVR